MHASALTGKPTGFYTAVFIVSLLPLYFGSYQFRLRHPYGGRAYPSAANRPSDDFVRDWLGTHVLEPFDPSAIATYCNATDWHPNLVFRLDNANGGIGNVRGNILDFLFYAIEAGASIILPDMASRSEDDISNMWADRASFRALFDEDWFVSTMAKACPQMAIYRPGKEEKLANALPGNYLPKSRRIDVSVVNSKIAYLEHLDKWLKHKPQFKPDDLTLVNLERTLWEVDTRSLPLKLRRNFGQLLRLTPTVRRLAAIAVQNLARKFHVGLDPRSTVPKRAFYGAHLRTEADAQNAGWLQPNTNFSAQTDAYISEAHKHKLTVMYVASGNASELARFKTKAASQKITVTSKLDLLPPDALGELMQLTWDQQALVDYAVLQRSSVFGGFVKSSFSYNIAMTRNQWLEDQGVVSDPWAALHDEDGIAYDDGISRVIGRDAWHEQRIPRGMWP